MDAAGRIFDRRWDLYDALHVVFTPAQMTADELQREVLRAYSRFYSAGQVLKHLAARRFGPMALYGWYWWFLRRWRRERANRAYLKILGRTPLGGASALATRSRR
jgi:hypothetical protein